MSFRFRKFPIYKELRLLALDLYKIANNLPKIEQHGLSPQLRRAITSVILNLAEGSMKKSDKEFRRFVLISIGSISEVAAILDICLDQKYITASIHKKYMLKCEAVTKQLYGFSRKLNN